MCANLRRYTPILIACCLLAACSSLTVKSPECEQRLPLPSASACPMPEPLNDGGMGTLFISYLENLGLMRECIAKYNQYRQQVEAREQACRDLRNQTRDEAKKWWQ